MTDQQETRPRGRPPVGPDTKYRLTPELKRNLAAAVRPGESEAAAVRRLLTVALSPRTAPALRLFADTVTTAEARAELGALAAAADLAPAGSRTLLAALDTGPTTDPATTTTWEG
jgi:hypothetical protein